MYTLLHGFYKYLVQKDEYCVLILGLDNAGKTVKSLFFRSSCYSFYWSRLLVLLFVLDIFGGYKNKVHKEI